MQTKNQAILRLRLIWFTAAISMAEILTGTWFCTTRMATRFNRHRRWTLYWWFDVFLCWLHRRKTKKVLCKRYKFHLVKRLCAFLFT